MLSDSYVAKASLWLFVLDYCENIIMLSYHVTYYFALLVLDVVSNALD